MKVLGISGSLRRDSYNTKLLRAAEELLPSDAELELYRGLKAVPPYDEEDDVQPAIAPVAALRQAVAEADAILIATRSTTRRSPVSSRTRWIGSPARSRRTR